MASTFPRRVDNVSDIMAVDVNRAYDALDYGWVEVSDTWAYASATTITVPTNATTFYQKGDRVRLKQGGAYKYYYIVTVAATLLTVTGGSDYTVANAAITDIAISRSFRPFGFPQRFSWTPTWTNLTVGNGTTTATFNVNESAFYFNLLFTLGSTSAVGTSPVFTPPITMGGSGLDVIGTVHMLGPGGVGYPGSAFLSTSTAVGMFAHTVTGSTIRFSGITATVPFTWATDHRIHVAGRSRY